MKRQLLLFSILIISIPGWALQKEFNFTPIPDLMKYIKETDKSPLKMSRLERREKADLVIQRFNDPKAFNEKRNNDLENPELYQSWIDEVAAGVNEYLENSKNPRKFAVSNEVEVYDRVVKDTKVQQALKIAKRQMYNAVITNWEALQKTIFNDLNVKNVEEARIVVQERLNDRLFFDPKTKNADYYLFKFADWGFVEVNKKNLKLGRVILAVDTRLQANKLEPGVEQLRAESDFKSIDQGLAE